MEDSRTVTFHLKSLRSSTDNHQLEDESENDAANVQSSQSSQSQCSRDVDHGDNNPSDNSVDTIRQCMREIRSELAGDINRLKSEVNVCLGDFGEKLQDLQKQVHLQSGNFSSNNRRANFQHSRFK